MTYMMEKEIYSQATIIENLINKYFKNYCAVLNIPLEINQIVIIASGSSYNAGIFGKYFFENISQVPATIEYASEFINSNSELNKNALYVFISQSGFSKDTLQALKMVKTKGLMTLSITNNVNSPMFELANYRFLIEAGQEQAIAATKTFSASVMTLWIIAIKIAQNKHLDITEETKGIYNIKSAIDKTLNDIDNLDYAAKLLSKQKSFSIAGFNYAYALSKEAGLKIQEICYISANAYPMGEFVHGHFAILNKEKTFLTFMSKMSNENDISYLNQILSTYKTKTIIISDSYEDYNCDILVKIPSTESNIGTIINMIIAIQLLALKTAIMLKRDVDKPNGLNKIVK